MAPPSCSSCSSSWRLPAGLLARHPQAATAHGLHYCGHHDNPAKLISLRAIDPERYAILNEENNEVIEEIEESNAFYEVYDGAVYMFQVGQR